MTSRWDEYAEAEAELRAAETAARATDYRTHLFADMSGTRAQQGAAFGFLDRQVPVELVETDPDRIGRGAIEGGLEASHCVTVLDAADPVLRGVVPLRRRAAGAARGGCGGAGLTVVGLRA